MKNNKIILVFSLCLILFIAISVVSASDLNEADLNIDDNQNSALSVDMDENNDFILESNSYSSLKYSLGDSENDNDLNVDKCSLENDLDKNIGFTEPNSNVYSNNLANSNQNNDGSDLGLDDSLEDDGFEWVANLTNKSDYVFLINSSNFHTFFDSDNELKPLYAGCTLVFEGEFNNLGIIKINSNDTRFTGRNSLFYNTAFDLKGEGIVLSNLNLTWDKEFSDNKHSAILVRGPNISIYNCTLNYTTPDDVTVFGIYSIGHEYDCNGLNVINNTINFYGHGMGSNDYNYAIFLRNTDNSMVYGNKIYCELPVKYIQWDFVGSYGKVSTDTVAAIAGDYCMNLTLSNNDIHTYVTDSSFFFPTLDTVALYGCNGSLIENNTILSEDFFSKQGTDNYLYVLDIYEMCNVTVIGNRISAFTNAGFPGSGTAYPIQITGPVNDIKIAFNNLTTFNRGPNCGIYSSNYFGETQIDIISNFINVTGDATIGSSGSSYSLVSGIEVQDNKDTILNNTIIVTNLGSYSSGANVYGISYIQNTGGSHSYNVQFNNITTNGNYGIKLIGNVNRSSTLNSTASNNVINTATTSNKTGASTKDQVSVPIPTANKNNTNGKFKKNMSADYYPDWLKDYINNATGRVNRDFTWVTSAVNNASNGTGFSNSIGNGSGLIDNGGDDNVGNGSEGGGSLINGSGDNNGSSENMGGNTNSSDNNGTDDGNGTGNGTADVPIDPNDPTDPETPGNITDPVNETNGTDPQNETDPADVTNGTGPNNETDPINVTNGTNPHDETDPVNETNGTDLHNDTGPADVTNGTEPADDSDPVNKTNSTVPVNDTKPINQTEIIDNGADITNQSELINNETDSVPTNNTDSEHTDEPKENNTNQTFPSIVEDVDSKDSQDSPQEEGNDDKEKDNPSNDNTDEGDKEVDDKTDSSPSDSSSENNNPIDSDNPKSPDESPDENENSKSTDDNQDSDDSKSKENNQNLDDSKSKENDPDSDTSSEDEENSKPADVTPDILDNPMVKSYDDSTSALTASSPGLSGASAARDVYELNRPELDDNILVKSVDYLSLAIICILALGLLIIGYKRQKNIEEEE